MRTCSNGARCISKTISLTLDNFWKASSGPRSHQFLKLYNHCRKRLLCPLTRETLPTKNAPQNPNPTHLDRVCLPAESSLHNPSPAHPGRSYLLAKNAPLNSRPALLDRISACKKCSVKPRPTHPDRVCFLTKNALLNSQPSPRRLPLSANKRKHYHTPVQPTITASVRPQRILQ